MRWEGREGGREGQGEQVGWTETRGTAASQDEGLPRVSFRYGLPNLIWTSGSRDRACRNCLSPAFSTSILCLLPWNRGFISDF